ncbi:hypothetical protein [Arenivirga flava]|uniref:Uncharacterized protein n=1 Tax=Arenivirga flava TaxID=1930060 RepID=A0AA37X846_9MICO|nr:hypothetical protein [Arenivirga flava]GMA27149.1 hypothetical protein GCM10025874_04020 [Arenivirga flava]
MSGRKTSLVLYGLQDHPESRALVECLGTVKLGASCLSVTRLVGVDALVLDELIRMAWNRPDHVEG